MAFLHAVLGQRPPQRPERTACMHDAELHGHLGLLMHAQLALAASSRRGTSLRGVKDVGVKDVGADEDTKRAAPAAPPMSGIEKARDAKARKKEEKRARKEQRHREAVAAAQGAVEDDSADGDNTASERTSISNSIITL